MDDNRMNLVLSTRIRLARNLKGLPFPWRLSPEAKRETAQRLADVLKEQSPAGKMQLLWMDQISREQAFSLVESHRISPEFVGADPGRALLWNEDGSVSIMLNEEDHLRVQITLPGEQLEAAYEIAGRMDRFLEEKLPLAFDDAFGYLTPNPNNLGTGMRASLMLHLPAMKENGAIQRTAGSLSKLGLTVRGLYGGGSEPLGAIYQVSNQVTLGLSEQDAISNLREITRQLIRQEWEAQQALLQDERTQDVILRSLGILQTARLLKLEEFMKLISNLRMGMNGGLISGITVAALNELTERAQSANLSVQETAKTPTERDRVRAAVVKHALRNVTENETDGSLKGME